MKRQVIKYKWEGLEPYLEIRGEGKKALFGQTLDFRIGKKFCTGFSRNGKSAECPWQRTVEDGWKCGECMLNDQFFMCIRCSGKECINPKRRNECRNEMYFVYLAAFGSVIKVGVSHEYRIMERLVEQGADFGAKIAYARDGMLVRKLEQEIKEHLGVTDRLRGKEKNNFILSDPNMEVANIMASVKRLRNNGFNQHLIEPRIYDLRGHYRIFDLDGSPRFMEIGEGGDVRGKVVAVKGNLVILKNDGELVSFNAHDIMGRELL